MDSLRVWARAQHTTNITLTLTWTAIVWWNFQIEAVNENAKFEKEIREEQEEKKRQEEEKKQRKAAFKEKSTVFQQK